MSRVTMAEQPVASTMSVRPSISRLVVRSLQAYRAAHLALALGAAAATAVILGALVVGDSVRGSLRRVVTDRLAQTETVLLSQKFFAPATLQGAANAAEERGGRISPLIMIPSGSAERIKDQETTRSGHVQVVGTDAAFWEHVARKEKIKPLNADEVYINQSLADELDAVVGDEITIRFAKGSAVPPDNPLGRRDDASESLPRQRVVGVLPDDSIGSFEIRPAQSVPHNVFVHLETLQGVLEQNGRVNGALTILPSDMSSADADSPQPSRSQELCDAMNLALQPSLEDFGFKLERHRRVFPDEARGEKSDAASKVIFDYYQIRSDQLIMDRESTEALMQALTPFQPKRSMTYLINDIVSLDKSSPSQPHASYSIAVGIEGFERPYLSEMPEGQIRRNECWVNRWLADRLELKIGSLFQMTFYKPETVDGRKESMTDEMRVVGILDFTEPAQPYRRNRPAVYEAPPTEFNDPGLTPTVPGVTDQDSISKWDLPFELTYKVSDEDDQYWNNHRLTPKIFLTYATAIREFRSRFGETTAIHVNAEDVESIDLLRSKAEQALLHTKTAVGLQFTPVRSLQLQAASGTTPFDGLFLALSFFVIVSALMLISLLFRLGLEQRAAEWGLYLATGFTVGRLRKIILAETLVTAAVGAALGVALGLGYAWLMILGLETWWVGAVGSRFLDFYVAPLSLTVGISVGGIVSLLTVVLSLRSLKSKQPLHLLRGRWQESVSGDRSGNQAVLAGAGFSAFAGCGCMIFGMTQAGMAQAGLFFGCGMLLLIAGLLSIVYLLRTGKGLGNAHRGLMPLAWSSLSRNPGRSVLSIGLLSIACFLISSMSVFQIAPDASGSGGYDLIAETAQPIYQNISSHRVRQEVLSDADSESIRQMSAISFRVKPGEDASCNNMFQVSRPTILGVPFALTIEQREQPLDKAFQWAARISDSSLPWEELQNQGIGTEESPVPVVIDQATAAWSLKQGASIGAITKIQIDDRLIYFRTVGLLSNSVLQGKLIISTDNFLRLFPEVNGYQFFLIRSKQKDPRKVIAVLENGWSDEGMDVSSSHDVLAKLLCPCRTRISLHSNRSSARITARHLRTRRRSICAA
ncbi:MAG: FtsX-like permease family protein [Pirellulales bacterium]